MIKDIIGEEGPIQMTFLIKSAVKALSSSGSPYLSFIFQDKSGTIEARMWQITEQDELLCVAGQVVSVEGIISTYKGHPQIRVEEINPVDSSSIIWEKYIPSAPLSTETLKEKVKEYIELIEDKEIKDLTENVIFSHEEDYFRFPAATTVHHAFLGGLAYHSLTICDDAIKIAKNYSILNKDYLIAGGLLHDIGKIVELTGYIATNYTTAGNLLGHLSIGANMVYEEGKKLKITEEILITLVHIIVSHHGKPEFGAIKMPMTPEAYVIHLLDDLDAKMEIFTQSFAQTEKGSFSKKIPWLENISAYKDCSKDDTD